MVASGTKGAQAGADFADQDLGLFQGREVPALVGLAVVDQKRGQDSDVFARHLPAGILSQVAYGAVFAIADYDLSNGTLGARAATITSLLMLGVPETRAIALVGDQT